MIYLNYSLVTFMSDTLEVFPVKMILVQVNCLRLNLRFVTSWKMFLTFGEALDLRKSKARTS